MKSVLTFVLKNIAVEILIICSFVFVMNHYVGTVEKSINADGEGYYDYLPSIFIHHDLVRKNDTLAEGLPLYARIKDFGIYEHYEKFKVNRYPCGTAVLQLPFFLYTFWNADLDGTYADGYQLPFQRAIYYTGIFYLFLTVLIFKKILKLYNIHGGVILFCQLLLVFATSVTYYATFDAGFSHIYSLFAISLFIYLTKLLFQTKKYSYFIYAAAALGLVAILRQSNLLIVLFVPFLAGSISDLIDCVKGVFGNKKILVIGVFSFLVILFVQLIIWYLQTGHFVLNSYQNYSFDFLNPHFYDILFSYKKGLFLYTPILVIAMLGLMYMLIIRKEYFLFFWWMVFFVILTYVLSSWWSWFFGCSYGLRAYIDFYPVFFIPFAIMLNGVNNAMKVVIVALSLITVPINLIQTYQYSVYILHWIDMDKEMYWKVFLETHEKYKGMVWKRTYDLSQYKVEKEFNIGNIPIVKNSNKVIFTIDCDSIPNFKQASIVQVFFDDDFKITDNSKFIFQVSRPEHVYVWTSIPIIHFHETKLDEFQTGVFNFEFQPIDDDSSKTIMLEVTTDNQDKILHNVQLKVLSSM